MERKESELSPKTKLTLPHKNVLKNLEISKVRMLQIILRKISQQVGMKMTSMVKTKSTSQMPIRCYKTFENEPF
jgi:hypothetical protein